MVGDGGGGGQGIEAFPVKSRTSKAVPSYHSFSKLYWMEA